MSFQLKGSMTAAGWHGLGCDCSRFIVLQCGGTCVALPGAWLLSFCFYVYTYSFFPNFVIYFILIYMGLFCARVTCQSFLVCMYIFLYASGL